MKSLLAFFYNHFAFVYLDPSYRFADSETTGSPVDRASLTITGPLLTIRLINERTMMQCVVAPTKNLEPKNWFWVELIRQYLDGIDATTPAPAKELATWLGENLRRVEALFAEDAADESCAALSEMRLANATKEFGHPKNL